MFNQRFPSLFSVFPIARKYFLTMAEEDDDKPLSKRVMIIIYLCLLAFLGFGALMLAFVSRLPVTYIHIVAIPAVILICYEAISLFLFPQLRHRVDGKLVAWIRWSIVGKRRIILALVIIIFLVPLMISLAALALTTMSIFSGMG